MAEKIPDQKNQPETKKFFSLNKKASLAVGKKKTEMDIFQKFSLEVVAGVVILALLSAFIIYPTVNSVLSTRETITAQQDILAQLEEKNNALLQAKKLEATLQDDLVKLDTAFPNNPDFIEDFKIIEKIGSDLTSQNYNFVLRTINLSEVPQENVDYANANQNYTAQEMSFTIGVNADYQGIEKFVEELGSNLRNFEVQRVTFSSSEENKGTVLEINLLMKTIYYGN